MKLRLKVLTTSNPLTFPTQKEAFNVQLRASFYVCPLLKSDCNTLVGLFAPFLRLSTSTPDLHQARDLYAL